MTIAFRTADNLAAHAVCMAAGFRDSLRTAQFYVRDLSFVDGGRPSPRRNVTFLSRLVARAARFIDRMMTWGADAAIAILLPSWRKLPSPFAPGMMGEVAGAIRRNSLLHNPLFNAYFFRAAIRIVQHYAEPPWLVLEHRIDAARRQLALKQVAAGESETVFLARVLLALADALPIARKGRIRAGAQLFAAADANVAVAAIACVSLLFAGEGMPPYRLSDGEFFAVVGALILPRLPHIAGLAGNRDVAGLAHELSQIKALY